VAVSFDDDVPTVAMKIPCFLDHFWQSAMRARIHISVF